MPDSYSNSPTTRELEAAKQELLTSVLRKEGIEFHDRQKIYAGAGGTAPLLSFAQQRLWFLDQLDPGKSVYNVSRTERITGLLDVSALQLSLEEIIRRHQVLRTRFPSLNDQPIPLIVPDPSLTLSVVDLRDLPGYTGEATARVRAAQEAQQPFDLFNGPLFRATLLRLRDDDHILLLTTHYIVCDDWSLGILFRELSILYAAFSAGERSPLSELPIQYADFAVWQRKLLQGEFLEDQLSYWRQKLLGAPAVLDLPTDRPRPPVQSFQGSRQAFVLSKSLTEALKALGRHEGVTLFMTLLAAFQTLLYRYTGQQDIVVGFLIANRNLAEIEGLIGFFVNTLVLRTDLSGDPRFRELLVRVREVCLGAYAHQDLPFEKLVEELHVERDLSRNPLFQVMFAFQNAPLSDLELPELSVSRMGVDSGTAKVDLTLHMAEGAGGLVGALEYATDLFDASTVKRMVDHFQTLLESIVADPERCLSELAILTEAERHQLLVEWNDTRRDYPTDKCIHQLFEIQVERTPEATAVVFEKQQLTYRELNRRANQLAHYLRKLGVGPETLVGICIERSLDMVAAVLGVLKVGGAYVPLDPTDPKERLAFMLEDARVSVLLTQRRLMEGLPEHGATVVCVDTDWQAIAQESEETPVSRACPENLAYVIYTSGSTGKPKGVQITHRGVINFLNSMRQQPGLTREDILLAVTTLSFDIAALELFLPLSVGARVVVVSREVASEGPKLLARLVESGATAMQATATSWRLLLEAGWRSTGQMKIFCGGEALPRELAIQLLARGMPVWNLYGPTESTIWSTLYLLELLDGSVPIGRPIANTEIYILDPYLALVPVSVTGELYIGGAGLARGYLHRPELTAEKFIPSPFSSEPGSRLYKSGDLGRYLPDGNIEFLGRIDHQIKLRGFRIELGEVESVLAEHPMIRETVVIAREDAPSDPAVSLRTGQRLVAYVVPRREPAPTINELRSFLKEKLPEHMIPSAFVLLDTLPLTPNGKVDRKALPAPDQGRPQAEESYIAPRTPVEEMLAEIWAEVLKLDKVGTHDNFFELGGHSLLATQVISQVRNTFQVEVPVRSLFEMPTVAGLANAIEEAKHRGAESLPPKISSVPRQPRRAPSSLQESLHAPKN
jgi:amino acid adenylation domain-containing protein